MDLNRAIGGFLLSFVFLLFFVNIIFSVQWIFGKSFINQNKTELLGSLSNSVSSSINLEQKGPGYALSPTQDIPELNIQAQAAISIWTNFSDPDKVLFSKNDQRKLSIASVSKLMTALIVIDNYDLSQEINISDKAANQSKDPEPLKAGEIFYAKDLLYAMLIGSDNAASYALSEGGPLGYPGTDKFIELMNQKAKELGLSDSSFLNPTGLGLDNFSTTQDLAKLAEYLLEKYQYILEITTIPEFYLNTIDGKISHKIVNTNELLNDSPDLAGRIIGGKTGATRTAGGCLLLVVKSSDNHGYFINVILNSNDRFGEIKKIINWVDNNYQ